MPDSDPFTGRVSVDSRGFPSGSASSTRSESSLGNAEDFIFRIFREFCDVSEAPRLRSVLEMVLACGHSCGEFLGGVMNLLQTMQVPVKLPLLVAFFCFPAWNWVVGKCQWLVRSWGGHGNKTKSAGWDSVVCIQSCGRTPVLARKKMHSTTLTRLNTKYAMR